MTSEEKKLDEMSSQELFDFFWPRLAMTIVEHKDLKSVFYAAMNWSFDAGRNAGIREEKERALREFRGK